MHGEDGLPFGLDFAHTEGYVTKKNAAAAAAPVGSTK